ncbi:hypothetical protein ACIBI9_63925 [Nonomuraea sp. NPDC050451]|uniref:hypothetical protein n=1 Tax=Nonomuraea sp. NPDC050451 TaxID=3364364 RepID=UPI0037A3F635
MTVAYCLTFYCRSGEEEGSSAMIQFLEALTSEDDRLLVECGTGDYLDQVAVCRLATDDGDGRPVADWLTLQLAVGVEYIAEHVIEKSPDDEHGIGGSDLEAEITLSGSSPDWSLVERIWTTLARRWLAVPWDEMSGFDVAVDGPP